MEDRGKKTRGEDGAEGRDKRRGKGGGAVEKERKVENALFFLCRWCTCARNCVFALSHFQNLFYPMEIRHPSECVCVCTCILFERVAFVCVSVLTSYCCVCVCLHA